MVEKAAGYKTDMLVFSERDRGIREWRKSQGTFL